MIWDNRLSFDMNLNDPVHLVFSIYNSEHDCSVCCVHIILMCFVRCSVLIPTPNLMVVMWYERTILNIISIWIWVTSYVRVSGCTSIVPLFYMILFILFYLLRSGVFYVWRYYYFLVNAKLFGWLYVNFKYGQISFTHKMHTIESHEFIHTLKLCMVLLMVLLYIY